jgi:DNA-binding transcriptional MerR regulator
MFDDHGVRSVGVTALRQQGFPTPVASKLTGISVSNLDNWARRGIIKPSIVAAPSSGISRVYSFRDLVAIRAIAELKKAGFTVREIGRVVDYLRKRKGLSTADVLASTLLATDGHDVYEVDGEARISAFQKPGQTVLLLLPLGFFVMELEKHAQKRAA